MNKLVGGVLIVQERGATSVKEMSLYGPWFQSSSDDGRASEEPLGPALTNMSPIEIGIILGSESDPFTIRKAELQRESMLKAFTHSEEHSGFVHVFKTSELRDNNLEFAWLLKKMLWLDKHTSALRLKFTFYNGNLKLFIFRNLNLWFSRSGVFYSTDTSSYTIQLKGVNLEPGLVSKADLGVECLFVLLVGVQAGQLLSNILNRVLEGDEDATVWRQRRNFLLSFWYSVYSIYWYKRTNTDADSPAGLSLTSPTSRSSFTACMSTTRACSLCSRTLSRSPVSKSTEYSRTAVTCKSSSCSSRA